ncbi:MAG TPA: hypothetical protein VID70_02970 [Solirubrobacteraceae bacterium]|jgi:hypothetical protein
MIMMDQSERLAQPLRWGRREKTAVAAVLACLVLALLALGVYGLTSGAPARADCVDVTFASTLGGAKLHGCGARAKTICASGGFKGIENELRSACQRAGFAYASARARSG